MAEFYPAQLTLESQALYLKIKAWAERRGEVTLWGGWAVHELVNPTMNYRSRDVDIIVHTKAVLDELLAQAGDWGLVLDFDRLDRIAFLRFKDDPTRTIQVDLFSSFELGYRHFPVEATVYHKPHKDRHFLPTLPALVADKVRTVPIRQGRDAIDKQSKDLLDIHRLVFHNKEGTPSPELLNAVSLVERRQAAFGRIERAKRDHPGFAIDYDEVAEWLNRP